MLKKTVKIALISTLATCVIYAGEANSTAAKDSNKTAKADNSAIVAAGKMLEDMGVENAYKKMIDTAVKVLVTREPKLKKIEGKIKAFYVKYTGWKALKPKISKIYAANYTTDELKKLDEFYKTPIGQKVLKLQPKIGLQIQRLSLEEISKHSDELNNLIKKTLENKKSKKSAKQEHKKEQKK